MDYLSPQVRPVIIRMGRIPPCECENDMKNGHDEGSATNDLVRRDYSRLEIKRSTRSDIRSVVYLLPKCISCAQ